LLVQSCLISVIARLNTLKNRISISLLVALSSLAVAQSITMSSPARGASVSSPVHFVATADGGNSSVSAVWIYVDGQPVYKTQSSSLNTYITLAPGFHRIVPTVRNDNGDVASETFHINVSSNVGVQITSPSAGAGVGSPVQFIASASAPTGRTIASMRIYVDRQSAYTVNASNLNTSLALSEGRHSINLQATDNAGAIYAKTMSISVKSGSTSQYQDDFNATSNWLSQSSAPDGALLYTPQQIDPYFANIAAIGMTKDPNRMPQVLAWMNWYTNHLNWPDKWGLYGTTYNYTISNGVETSTKDADSTDSYAATFLTLAWNAWENGDSNARAYISSLSYQLDVIGGVLVQTQQSDGLTWAKPDYQIKYLMDNCEGYRGLRDLASLFQAMGSPAKASYYTAAANSMLNGILGMWMNGKWAVYKDYYGNFIAPNMKTWYADATAQVFPVLLGVVSSSDTRAQESYAAFNAAWPGWPMLSFNAQDPFPWCLVVDAAAAMGDNARVATYINSIQASYVDKNLPWPFYIAEGGWFMRANSYMLGKGL